MRAAKLLLVVMVSSLVVMLATSLAFCQGERTAGRVFHANRPVYQAPAFRPAPPVFRQPVRRHYERPNYGGHGGGYSGHYRPRPVYRHHRDDLLPALIVAGILLSSKPADTVIVQQPAPAAATTKVVTPDTNPAPITVTQNSNPIVIIRERTVVVPRTVQLYSHARPSATQRPTRTTTVYNTKFINNPPAQPAPAATAATTTAPATTGTGGSSTMFNPNWTILFYLALIVGAIALFAWLARRGNEDADNRAVDNGRDRSKIMEIPTPPAASGNSYVWGYNLIRDGRGRTTGMQNYDNRPLHSNQPPAVDPRYRREEAGRSPIFINYGGGQPTAAAPVVPDRMPQGVGRINVEIHSEAAVAAQKVSKPAAPKK